MSIGLLLDGCSVRCIGGGGDRGISVFGGIVSVNAFEVLCSPKLILYGSVNYLVCSDSLIIVSKRSDASSCLRILSDTLDSMLNLGYDSALTSAIAAETESTES